MRSSRSPFRAPGGLLRALFRQPPPRPPAGTAEPRPEPPEPVSPRESPPRPVAGLGGLPARRPAGNADNPDKEIPEVYDHPGTARRLAELDAVAAELGATRGQTVLAWYVAHGVRPMLGGSKVAQLDAAMDAVRLGLSAEQLARLDQQV